MKTYTIDAEDNITAFGSAKEISGTGDVERFGSTKELAKLAEGWPAARLVAIWNSLPGGEPVKRFQSRKVAVERIWAAIQRLEPAVAPQTATVAPRKAKRGKKPAAAPLAAPAACDGSKKAAVLELIRRAEGATLTELMAATGWQAHSVRGFLSGAVGKKMGLPLTSAKREDGQRIYSIPQ
jgi:Protein of unknown function (DUF3489)